MHLTLVRVSEWEESERYSISFIIIFVPISN
jgi:hypothetical protein